MSASSAASAMPFISARRWLSPQITDLWRAVGADGAGLDPGKGARIGCRAARPVLKEILACCDIGAGAIIEPARNPFPDIADRAERDQHERGRCGAADETGGGDRPGPAQGPFDEGPAQHREQHRQSQPGRRFGRAGIAVAPIARQDQHRPVPQVERVGRSAGEDHRRQCQHPVHRAGVARRRQHHRGARDRHDGLPAGKPVGRHDEKGHHHQRQPRRAEPGDKPRAAPPAPGVAPPARATRPAEPRSAVPTRETGTGRTPRPAATAVSATQASAEAAQITVRPRR